MKLTKVQRREKKRKELEAYWTRKTNTPFRRICHREVSEHLFMGTPIINMILNKRKSEVKSRPN